MQSLKTKKVAVVVTNGFEQSEFEEPVNALRKEGAEVVVISLTTDKIKSWKDKGWGDEFEVQKAIDDVSATDYDALVLPGGVMNPDQLRANKAVVAFATEFMKSGKSVAAICHGPWTLVETGELKGRTVTSFPSLQTDLKNAGATWVDKEVVVDKGLITSRNPGDLPAFCAKLIEEISEGVHNRK
ncbi:MAG: type 1 glutamine amidotransferase [Taibaiella sp.]|nr:type 1 glutamine amidotransferase [Taibaiella sp.]